MVTTQLESIVPACPQGLAISRADFLRHDFTVDKFFIEQSVKETPLDTLRDDLGIYLKVLRSSMIELINQDYADFVNLSTNLVGLDKGILAIQDPLEDFHKEIQAVNADITTSLDMVRSRLARQSSLREDKAALASLKQTSLALAKIERVVAGEITTDSAERLATEINQLQFAVWKLDGSVLVQEVYRPRLESVCDQLHSWLDIALLEEVQNGGSQLSRLCRVYSSIGRVEGAELVVREGLVRPQVQTVLTEGGELCQVCAGLLRILPDQLGGLLRLTTDSRGLVGGSLQGFNFLAHSYWPEVADQFQRCLGHIYGAGNPEEFHRNFTVVQNFLSSLEELCCSEATLDKLRSREDYSVFQAAWNLPLYFQIRFQEIARPYEESLVSLDPTAASSEGPKLQATVSALQAVDSCFSPSVFLRPLAARFLKLALQVVSRYQVWAVSCLAAFTSPTVPQDEVGMKRSTTTKDLAEEKGKPFKKSASAQHLGDLTASPQHLTVSVSQLTLLHADLQLLLSLLPSSITFHFQRLLPDLQGSEVQAVVSETVTHLQELLPSISSALVTHITVSPLRQLKGVIEIPRMYRRTNRETPSKPCAYVLSTVDSLTSFVSSHSSCPPTVLSSWLSTAGDTLLDSYLVQVTDVLSNVAKMEESLRKLKKVRDRQETKETKPGLSDDDKIRLQLYIDVHFLLRKLEELGGKVEGDSSRTKIVQVVDSAVEKFVGDVQLL